jgi:hypothetical protein
MSEPLTNAILASILHLIQRDLTGNGRVPPRRAPPRWVPPRRAPAHWQHRAPQERTKGGDTAPTVPAHGTVIAKNTRAVTGWATAATIWHTLHPKITSRS